MDVVGKAIDDDLRKFGKLSLLFLLWARFAVLVSQDHPKIRF